MLKDSQPPRYSVPRTRRTYTPQFKTELVAACLQPGASIAALALQHGMNANVLHRWLKEHRHGQHSLVAVASNVAMAHHAPQSAFIPIELNATPPASTTEPAPVAASADIRIECRRGDVTVNMHWPVSAAAQCAQMLRELLR